ncbi:MAG: oligosaccharide flippase family protein, partial [Brevinematales bacterium]
MQGLFVSLPIVGKWLSHRPMLLRVVENIGWLSLDKVLRMGVGLFVGVWVARYLGPTQYGLWNFAIAFTSLFGAFATFGIDEIVVRELVKTPEKTGVFLGTAFFLRVAGSFI